MGPQPLRQTVDLSQYPDLVVIYLGMKAKSFRGLKTLIAIRPQIQRSVSEKPEGLLLHEDIIFSFAPPHFGMRQYWRDFDSLEAWARSGMHSGWWRAFIADQGGTGFWHELYSREGAMEGSYLGMDPVGLMRFAPVVPSRGPMFSARGRLGKGGVEKTTVVLTEEAVYSNGGAVKA
jgi:Domain of unknown function (DUF4188)